MRILPVLIALFAGLAVATDPASVRADIMVTPLHEFDGEGDGGTPVAVLADGGDGYLYGTASVHGSGVADPAGTVFRVSPGSFQTLYTFDFQVTGDTPLAGVLPIGGDLYGTTRGTGAYQGNVFRIASDGSFHELHGFKGYILGPDGAHPQSDLVGDGSGNLYGTTYNGGDNDVGTVFRIAANGDYTLLHSFHGRLDPADGFYPLAGLTDGGDGNFYGTTGGGGPSGSLGTVFRMTPAGDVTMIHEFVQLEDGGSPASRLVLSREDGRLYGTTTTGGVHGYGTVFRISTSEDFESLYSFDNSNGDGYPPNGLVEGSDGNFYGTTGGGGANYFGTVFGVTPTGRFKTLYSFSFQGSAGFGPRAALVQGDGDVFYGTTTEGGMSGCTGSGCGFVFEIDGLIAAPEPGAALERGTTALAIALLPGRRRVSPRV
jgi:uncharacterized repeat protein (TIGR03803 family)